MSKSVYKHFYGDASSSACAQVDSNWTEDGALEKGISCLRNWVMEAWQMRETAAEPFGSALQCFVMFI